MSNFKNMFTIYSAAFREQIKICKMEREKILSKPASMYGPYIHMYIYLSIGY